MKLYLNQIEKKISKKGDTYYLAKVFDYDNNFGTNDIFVSEKFYNNFKDKIKNGSMVELVNNEFGLRPELVNNQACYKITYIGG